MTLTLADLLAAMPGAWQHIERKSIFKSTPQRARVELALEDHLTLALEVTTQAAQARRLGIVGWDAPPLPVEVYLLNAQGHDAAPGVLGLAKTTEEAVAVAADKVTRAILCGRDPKRLPPWLSFRVAERLRAAAERATRIGLRFVTDPAAEYDVKLAQE